MSKLSLQRTLPPRYKHLMTLETMRTYRLVERIKILIGFSTVTRFDVFMEHSCGKFEANPATIVVKEKKLGVKESTTVTTQ